MAERNPESNQSPESEPDENSAACGKKSFAAMPSMALSYFLSLFLRQYGKSTAYVFELGLLQYKQNKINLQWHCYSKHPSKVPALQL